MARRGQDQQTIEARVRRSILADGSSADDLPVRGSRLLVAVSGGADSVCLLHVLSELADEFGLTLHVAHLDHCLRGAESAADAGYVARLARRLGIAATVERRDVAGHRREHRLSLEEAAREVRYRFLAETARAVGAGWVATGHTRDDHAETVLMHLIRGSGTTGLRGLRPLSRWRSGDEAVTVIRPLLEVGREETAEYCRRRRLRPRVDSSNRSLSPLRNRLRLRLLPQLREYNPRIVEALVRTAAIAGDDLAVVDGEIERQWQRVARREGETVILDRKGFGELAAGVRRGLLRRAVAAVRGDLKDVEARHVEEMLVATELPPGRAIDLPGGLRFAVDYDRYLIGDDPGAVCPLPELAGETAIEVPGTTEIPGWRIRAEVAPVSEPAALRPETDTGDGFVACLDAAVVGTFVPGGDRLTVRSRRRGDSFRPLGMTSDKKLARFMIDARIPRAWRSRVPVVVAGGPAVAGGLAVAGGRIVWLVGWRIDDRAKVTGGTERALRLSFERRVGTD
ncbi:MAG: tRNA lysidine(34) synthetase TilS [Dehalococcoidales bacterium]